MQALLHNLGLEGLGIRASLAHGNPSEMGDRVAKKIERHNRPNAGILKACRWHPQMAQGRQCQPP
ncbi:hypothetical protein EMIT0P218_30251 [Pseudomonas sp. IT-P218]